MSMAINRAKYTGDPGIFDFFKDILVGGIKGGIGSLKGPPQAGPGGPRLAPNGGFRIDPRAAFPGGAPFISRMPAANGCPPNGSMAGYHLNKSDYFVKSGEFVPEGTRWVKNRKRNPANARATSRAISRITGAKKYASALGRISIRKKC